ncbi:MAG: hypothetical protein MUC34_01355 [Anaerolineae bacterium]|nr:hypothetical protein [Anaerolineae bacterium]
MSIMMLALVTVVAGCAPVPPLPPPQPTATTAPARALSDIYTVLLHAIDKDVPLPSTATDFAATTLDAANQIIADEFKPQAYRLTGGVAEGNKFRFTQADYSTFFLAYSFGNEGEWKDKLYRAHFGARLFGDRGSADEKQTSVYKELVALYGDPARVEKFRYSAAEESLLNMYIWERPEFVVTYRSPYSPASGRNPAGSHVVVEYWNPEFYRTHRYYDGY